MHTSSPHPTPAERLYQQKERFLSFILNKVKRIEDAEDVFQVALTEALASEASVESGGCSDQWFQPFLDRSIRSHAQRTSDHERLHVEINDVEEVPDPDGPWEESPRNCVLACLRMLRETDARLILWLDIQGHSQKDLAKRMGIPASAVSSRHVRARARMRILLEDWCGTCQPGRYCYRPDRSSGQKQDGPRIGSLTLWAMSKSLTKAPMALIRF